MILLVFRTSVESQSTVQNRRQTPRSCGAMFLKALWWALAGSRVDKQRQGERAGENDMERERNG